MITALLHAALPLLLAATTDAAAGAPTVRVASDTVRADENGMWPLTLALRNPGQYSLRGDSLFADVTDLDPGVSRAPRTTTATLSFFIQRAGTVGSNENKVCTIAFLASCERARIVLRLAMHDGGGTPYAFRDSLVAEPGPLAAALPSSFVVVKGRRVELVTVPAGAAGKVPGVLLVPAETAHARRLAFPASQIAARGINVVAVSPPGYGLSDGPADMCGPATLAALEAALARLVAMPGTDRTQLAVWGTGRGATAALLLAARHPEIARVIAQDAGYDLWASWRAADEATRADIAAEAGADSAGWKARSPLLAPGRLAAPVLVIQSDDPGAPMAQARAFAAARFAARAPVDTLWAVPGGHRLRKDAMRTGIEFLARPGGH